MPPRKPYDPHQRVHTPDPGPTMTKQSMQAECDINNILAKYQKTGLITHATQGGNYQDLPSDTDYQNGLNIIIAAQESFDALPSTVRREFENDPAQFLSFIEDPANVDRMRALGLLNDPPPAPPAEADPEPPAAEGP